MTQTIPTPTNALLNVIHTVTDTLISGAGVEVAIAAGIAEVPALGLPGVRQLYGFAVTTLADTINKSIKQNIDVLVIRYQGDALKKSYDQQIDQLKDQLAETEDRLTLSEEQLDDLRKKAQAVINQSR